MRYVKLQSLCGALTQFCPGLQLVVRRCAAHERVKNSAEGAAVQGRCQRHEVQSQCQMTMAAGVPLRGLVILAVCGFLW